MLRRAITAYANHYGNKWLARKPMLPLKDHDYDYENSNDSATT